jgi:hypothetical protein
MHVCMHACMHVCMYVCICVCVQRRVSAKLAVGNRDLESELLRLSQDSAGRGVGGGGEGTDVGGEVKAVMRWAGGSW